MATNAVPVTADRKDEEGVKEVKANVPGVGELLTYFKVETVDDVDGKTTDDVLTLKLSVPVETEVEFTVMDNGAPAVNEDGSVKKDTRVEWRLSHFELDMGKASREKLTKALEPFLKNARDAKPSYSAAPVSSAPSTSKSPHDLNAIRAWAKENGHEVADKGRIAVKVIEAYYKETGKPNPEA